VTKEFNLQEFQNIYWNMAVKLYNEKYVPEGSPQLTLDENGNLIKED